MPIVSAQVVPIGMAGDFQLGRSLSSRESEVVKRDQEGVMKLGHVLNPTLSARWAAECHRDHDFRIHHADISTDVRPTPSKERHLRREHGS